ncbi:hypothetical protein [Mucilaginibacter sp.]|jgi:Tol biopolymer transport system component|uniref:TolB family protein n=1 Tax=Mucilaginibacter sp. TaxID=1882438 RepID=UPI002C5C266B|nr:hypothetical protein [Mucilaginibacter sp.]HTI58527.1 hypothetical protein [Mucilaginibacter sp.]
MKKIVAVIALLGSAVIGQAQNSKNLVPQVFQPGVISKGDYESHGTFTPSGDTLYFIKCSYDLKISAICVSYKRNGKWTEPAVASFSGKYMDADPFVAKDGRSLYFMSNRPLRDGDPAKDDTDIWMVRMTKNGWGAPVRLNAPINSEKDEYYPTLADNGNIYFGSTRAGGKGGSDIWCCKYKDGKYQPAENLGDAINTPYHDYEAFIAPDESYLIYNSSRPNGLKNLDFYISYKQNGMWTKAKKLPEPISSNSIDWSPKVTRDGKWFYFGSTRSTDPATPAHADNMQRLNRKLQSANNGLSDIYIVDFEAIKQALK